MRGNYREAGVPPQIPGAPEGAGTSLAKLLIPLLIPLFFMLVVVPTGFLLESPGPSFDLQADLTVVGAETYPSYGEFLLTAVSLQESRLVYHILTLFDEGFEMISVKDYLGEDLDTEEQDALDELVTILSQNAAVVVGLGETGNPVVVEELGALVVTVGEEYPAYGVLETGDVIVAVDGEPIQNTQMLTERIGAKTPEDDIRLTVRKVIRGALLEDGENGLGPPYETQTGLEDGLPDPADFLSNTEREVVLRPVYEPELGRSIIGVSLRDYFSYSSSVDVEWDLETVKGPSAGLMMTLSLVNVLTPEDLTGGEKIAGTGEIFLDGDVGPIGGLPFKIQAAEREGAEIFIYPVENQADLEGVSTELQLYPVDNLQEALEILERAG